MAVAIGGLAPDWGFFPLAFSAGLVWRPSPPPVHLHCSEVLDAAGPPSRAGLGFSGWLGLLLAFALGLVAGRVWGTFVPVWRFRRAARVPPQPLFG